MTTNPELDHTQKIPQQQSPEQNEVMSDTLSETGIPQATPIETTAEHESFFRRRPVQITGVAAAAVATIVGVGAALRSGNSKENIVGVGSRATVSQSATPSVSPQPTVSETTPIATPSETSPTAIPTASETESTTANVDPLFTASVTPEQWMAISSDSERQKVLEEFPDIKSKLSPASFMIAKSQGYLTTSYIKKFQSTLHDTYQNEDVHLAAGDPPIFSEGIFQLLSDTSKQSVAQQIERFHNTMVNTGAATYPLIGEKFVKLASMNDTLQKNDITVMRRSIEDIHQGGGGVNVAFSSETVVLNASTVKVAGHDMVYIDTYSKVDNFNDPQADSTTPHEYFNRYLMVPTGPGLLEFDDDAFAPVLVEQVNLHKN